MAGGRSAEVESLDGGCELPGPGRPAGTGECGTAKFSGTHLGDAGARRKNERDSEPRRAGACGGRSCGGRARGRGGIAFRPGIGASKVLQENCRGEARGWASLRQDDSTGEAKWEGRECGRPCERSYTRFGRDTRGGVALCAHRESGSHPDDRSAGRGKLAGRDSPGRRKTIGGVHRTIGEGNRQESGGSYQERGRVL